jgi:hypothetical protein
VSSDEEDSVRGSFDLNKSNKNSFVKQQHNTETLMAAVYEQTAKPGETIPKNSEVGNVTEQINQYKANTNQVYMMDPEQPEEADTFHIRHVQ